jgi:hypothetical protein
MQATDHAVPQARRRRDARRETWHATQCRPPGDSAVRVHPRRQGRLPSSATARGLLCRPAATDPGGAAQRRVERPPARRGRLPQQRCRDLPSARRCRGARFDSEEYVDKVRVGFGDLVNETINRQVAAGPQRDQKHGEPRLKALRGGPDAPMRPSTGSPDVGGGRRSRRRHRHRCAASTTSHRQQTHIYGRATVVTYE